MRTDFALNRLLTLRLPTAQLNEPYKLSNSIDY